MRGVRRRRRESRTAHRHDRLCRVRLLPHLLPAAPLRLPIAAIYNAIGVSGVYYGFLLGKSVPWVSCFPFNMGVSHPQYWGSTMTIWAAVVALWDKTHGEGLLCVGLCWSLLYAFSAAVEQFCKPGKALPLNAPLSRKAQSQSQPQSRKLQ